MSFIDRKKYEKVELLRKHEKEVKELKKKQYDEMQQVINRHLKEENDLKIKQQREDIEFEKTLFNQIEKLQEK